MSDNTPRSYRRVCARGFSAVELLVVVSIIIILSTVIIFDYTRYSSSAGLRLAAQDLEVTIREAQVYGIAIKEEEGSPNIFPDYGIYVDGSNNQEVVFFANTDGNNTYDSGVDSTVKTFRLDTPYTISDVCTNQDGGNAVNNPGFEDCWSEGLITSATAIFHRPEPDPLVVDDRGATPKSYLKVTLSSPSGSEEHVYVWTSSQISVVSDPAQVNYSSCPFIYAWDGEEWHFDHEAYPFAVTSALETVSYEKLSHLKSRDGIVKLQLREELPEVSWTDRVSLFAVDHAPQEELIVDQKGRPHVVANRQRPLSCLDKEGADCTSEVADVDGIFWSSDTSSIPRADGDYRDFILVRFRKPSYAESVNIVFRAQKTRMLHWVWDDTLRMVGQNNFPQFESLTGLPGIRGLWRDLFYDHGAALRVSMMRDGAWDEIDTIVAGRERLPQFLVHAPVSGIEEDVITLKFESGFNFYEIDEVFASYTDKPELAYEELPLVSAIKNGNSDVASALQDGDDVYIQTTDLTHDIVELVYDDKGPVPSDMVRSYFVAVEGYYNFRKYPEKVPSRTYLSFLKDVAYPSVFYEGAMQKYYINKFFWISP